MFLRACSPFFSHAYPCFLEESSSYSNFVSQNNIEARKQAHDRRKSLDDVLALVGSVDIPVDHKVPKIEKVSSDVDILDAIQNTQNYKVSLRMVLSPCFHPNVVLEQIQTDPKPHFFGHDCHNSPKRE